MVAHVFAFFSVLQHEKEKEKDRRDLGRNLAKLKEKQVISAFGNCIHKVIMIVVFVGRAEK